MTSKGIWSDFSIFFDLGVPKRKTGKDGHITFCFLKKKDSWTVPKYHKKSPQFLGGLNSIRNSILIERISDTNLHSPNIVNTV